MLLRYADVCTDYRTFNFGSFGAVPRTVWAAYQGYQERMEAVPDPWMRSGATTLVHRAVPRLTRRPPPPVPPRRPLAVALTGRVRSRALTTDGRGLKQSTGL